MLTAADVSCAEERTSEHNLELLVSSATYRTGSASMATIPENIEGLPESERETAFSVLNVIEVCAVGALIVLCLVASRAPPAWAVVTRATVLSTTQGPTVACV